MSLRILIADDHPLLIDGLVRVLEEMAGTRVVETVGNGRRLLDRLREVSADLILLDLQMPQLDGLETLRVLRREFPQVRVLIFTNYNQPKLVQEARSAGARGYLSKNCSSAVLKEAVMRVSAGGVWFEEPSDVPEAKTFFADDFMRKHQLTVREVEILRRIAQGYTSRQIGEQLFVSEFTVNAHRRNICRKLDIHTAVGLVNFAKENRLV
jgi:DNA-binding NarL/FixJ family response regulator